jgi:hypothetical protein
MAKHVYLVVTCKTAKCGNLCAIKYYGLYKGRFEIGKQTPAEFWYKCGECSQDHRYEIEEARMELYDAPPAPGWRSPWEP